MESWEELQVLMQWSPLLALDLRVTNSFQSSTFFLFAVQTPSLWWEPASFLSGLLHVSICLVNRQANVPGMVDRKSFISVVDVVELIHFLKEENPAYGSK